MPTEESNQYADESSMRMNPVCEFSIRIRAMESAAGILDAGSIDAVWLDSVGHSLTDPPEL